MIGQQQQQPLHHSHRQPGTGTPHAWLWFIASMMLMAGIPATFAIREQVSHNAKGLVSAQSYIDGLAHQGLPAKEATSLTRQLISVHSTPWGPFPSVWFTNQTPAFNAIRQRAYNDWQAVLQTDHQSLNAAGARWVATVTPWDTGAKIFEKTALEKDRTVAKIVRQENLWIRQTHQWVSAETRLKKLGTGLVQGRPRAILNGKTALEEALNNARRNPEGVPLGQRTLQRIQTFWNLPPTQELTQFTSLEQQIKQALQKLAPIPLPPPPPPSSPATSSTLASAVEQYLTTRQSQVSAAVLNLNTGTLWSFQPQMRYDTASIVKATIMATLLWQAELHHAPLTPEETQQMVPMIEDSSNQAATTLWYLAGGSRGIQGFLNAAGLTNTIPGTHGYWGLTQTTVTDQVELMKLYAVPNAILDPASQAYARNLMTHIVGYEDWGVNSGAPTGASVALKNGWLPLPGLGWEINSVGYVSGGNEHIAIAILSNRNPTEAYGIATVDHIAALIEQSES